VIGDDITQRRHHPATTSPSDDITWSAPTGGDALDGRQNGEEGVDYRRCSAS
jgi:hypothetical protein